MDKHIRLLNAKIITKHKEMYNWDGVGATEDLGRGVAVAEGVTS